ncbi:hypothetical protein V2J09_021072, partial [Rumex salicifolius]
YPKTSSPSTISLTLNPSVRDDSRIYLSQSIYIRDLIKRTHMAQSKGVQTLMTTSFLHSTNHQASYADTLIYWSVDGGIGFFPSLSSKSHLPQQVLSSKVSSTDKIQARFKASPPLAPYSQPFRMPIGSRIHMTGTLLVHIACFLVRI